MHIVLISCVKVKLDHPARARELYISPLFKLSLRYAESLCPDKIFILSAKYGIVGLDQHIEPYELTLNKMKIHEAKAWSEKVIKELKNLTDIDNDEFTIVAGEKYRRFLLPHIRHYSIPTKGLSFGKTLQFLKVHTK
jgi:cytoplasmic iron level regulating protein YaaA (DUF328/UPF0246 family)